MQARGNLPILDFTGEPERTFFIKFRSVLFTSKVRTSTRYTVNNTAREAKRRPELMLSPPLTN